MKQDKQQQLTKFYPLQPTSKKNKCTIDPIILPTPTMKQPSISTFLQPNKPIEERSRLEKSRRNEKSIHPKNSAIVFRNSYPKTQVSSPTNQKQTHLNQLFSYRQQPNKAIHQDDVNLSSSIPDHAILSPYLSHPNNQRHNRTLKIPPTQPTKITLQKSQITSIGIYEPISPENNIAYTNRKINNLDHERISSSTNKSSILQQLPTTNRTEQIDNKPIQKEGEQSRRNNKDSKKSYAEIVSLIIRRSTKINNSTKPTAPKIIYPPKKKNNNLLSK